MKSIHLGRKLVLEAPVRAPDGGGGHAQEWVALGVVWADVQFRFGREANAIAGRESEADYKIIVRGAPHGSPSRPVPGQRFVEGIRRYLIEAVGERDPKGRYLTCYAREELAL